MIPVIDTASIVREMLATIGTLTTAGQRYTMAKIASLIDDRINRADRVAVPWSRIAAELLEGLTQESERLSPDVQAFATRAETLIGLLTA
jgi:hypothetical protein